MKLSIIPMLLVAICLAQTGEPSDVVFNRLAKVDRFAFGGTGFAGVISQGEKDYRTILAGTSARADFERLYLEGNVQAKCYALVGIRALNPDRFKELSRSLRNSKEEVLTQSGCIVLHESLGAVLKRIETGWYSK